MVADHKRTYQYFYEISMICCQLKHGSDAELGITLFRYEIIRVRLVEMTNTYYI